MRIMHRLSARSHNPGGCRPPLIVCLGDSVTHSCFELDMPENHWQEPTCRPWDGFPMKLQDRLARLYPLAAPTVFNAGVGGDAVSQMDARLERDVLSLRPDLVILEVGLNDCLGSETDDPTDFGQAVGALMDRILASGAELMLLTPNAMCARMHENVPKEDSWRQLYARAVHKQVSGTMTAFVNAARIEAEKRSVPVADAYARWEAMRLQGIDTTSLLANQINHPKPEMHDLFVEEILRTMQMA